MKYPYLIYSFLLGFSLALIIFGFFTPLFPNFLIRYTVERSLPDWITAISTTLAVFTALGISLWRKSLEEFFYKPDINLLDSLKNFQEYTDKKVTQGQTRLLIKNTGNGTAIDVEAYVSKIYDNGNPRTNFIAVPLYWTHNGSRRDFHPNQFGYLDFCRIDRLNDPNCKPKLVLAAGAGVPTYEEIREKLTTVELIIFQKSGQIKSYSIDLDWLNNLEPVRVIKFSEIKFD